MPARRSSRHRAVRRHRPRLLLGVIVASAVAAAGAFLTTTTAARIMWSSGVPPITGTECLPAAPATDSACPQASAPTAATSTVADPSPPASGTPPATQWPSSSSTRRASTPPTPARKPAGTHSGQTATQVLKLVNAARGQAGLPPYTLTTGLCHSAARHDAVMAGGCGLSHQCPGEPSLGARETAAGVPWTTAGENIGEGGPVANSPGAIAQMAAVLTQDMLNEKPPNDGHRQNMLSREFHHIGIAVYRDSSGTVWMTQDFSD